MDNTKSQRQVQMRRLPERKPRTAIDSGQGDFYRQLSDHFNQFQGPHKAFADSTMLKDDIRWKLWKSFCEDVMAVDAIQAMKVPDTGFFLSYLTWYLGRGEIRLSTAQNHFKSLDRLSYSKTGKRIPEDIKEPVFKALHQDGILSRQFNLCPTMKEKPTVSIDDFWCLLKALWNSTYCSFVTESLRIQFHFSLLLSGMCGCRPGSLFGTESRDRDIWHFLDWEHCELILLPREDRSVFPLIVLRISFVWTKGGKGQIQPVVHILHEAKHLALDPVFWFITLACAHGAFSNSRLCDPVEFFRLRVPDYLQQLKIPFRDDILRSPVFCRPVWQGSWQLSRDPISQRVMSGYMNYASKAADWPKAVTYYALRRSNGNAIDEHGNTSIRNQVMGHSNSQIFEIYYRSQEVRADVQSMWLGLPSETHLIQRAGGISRTADPRIPKTLSSEDWTMIRSKETTLRKLDNMFHRIRRRCISEFDSMKSADDFAQRLLGDLIIEKCEEIKDVPDELLEQQGDNMPVAIVHMEVRRRIKNERQRLRTYYLQKKINEFLKTQPVEDIEVLLSDQPRFISKVNPYAAVSEHRTRLSQSFFTDTFPVSGCTQDISSRTEVMQTLIDHWYRCEPKKPMRCSKRKHEELDAELSSSLTEDEDDEAVDSDQGSDHSEAYSDDKCIPLELPANTCIHCLFDPANRHRRWEASVKSRKDALQRHAQTRHFKFLDPTQLVCPHTACKSVSLDDEQHFKNHVWKVHKVLY